MRLSRWNWRADFKSSGVLGENWLFVYVRRRWTTDTALVKSVKQDYILGKMLSADVTFLDDQILDAAHISIVRRRFRKMAAELAAGAHLTEAESELELLEYF